MAGIQHNQTAGSALWRDLLSFAVYKRNQGRVTRQVTFADFLIAVETEMTKVSWPSTDEVIRSSAVVIFLIFALAAILAAYDLFWWFVLRAIQGPR